MRAKQLTGRNQQHVLVVGGAGYIGSHMLLCLQAAGYNPVAMDNLSRGHADAVGTIPLYRGDLTIAADIERVFSAYEFSLVIHFAAMAYVGESVTDPSTYYRNNVLGTLQLLESMRRHRVPRMVFSSSCATYGEPERIPIEEGHAQRPINPYGRSKLMSEQMMVDFASAYDMKIICLRYFNAAGADPYGRAGERHDPETHLIPLVLAEAVRVRNGGDPSATTLQVFGCDFPTSDGSCVRDYVHVSDLCDAHLLAVDRLLEMQTAGLEAFNLSNNRGFTVFEVVEACRRITGQPIQYNIRPRRNGDPSVLVGDSNRARRVLGWRPHYTELDAIIQTAWQWIQHTDPQIRSSAV